MKRIFFALIVIGLLAAIGTAGAVDNDTIDDGQARLQLVIAVASMVTGITGIYIIENTETVDAEDPEQKETAADTHNIDDGQAADHRTASNYFGNYTNL